MTENTSSKYELYKGVDWLTLRSIGSSKAAKLTILVPIVGYMIIFNDQLSSYLDLSRELLNIPEATEQGLQSYSIYRIYIIYFGLVFVGIASAIFAVRCPNQIKDNESFYDFFVKEREMITNEKFQRYLGLVKMHEVISPIMACMDNEGVEMFPDPFSYNVLKTGNPLLDQSLIRNSKDKKTEEKARLYKECLSEVLHLVWDIRRYDRPNERRATTALYAVGLLMLAIPSIEVFLRVVSAAADMALN